MWSDVEAPWDVVEVWINSQLNGIGYARTLFFLSVFFCLVLSPSLRTSEASVEQEVRSLGRSCSCLPFCAKI